MTCHGRRVFVKHHAAFKLPLFWPFCRPSTDDANSDPPTQASEARCH